MRRVLAALGMLTIVALPAYAQNVEKAPPGGQYKKVSELVKLPDFLPGLGTLYVDPKTLPAGPFLAYDHEGRLVSTIYMIPIKDITDQKKFDDLASPGGRQRRPSRCAGTALSRRALACIQGAGTAGREIDSAKENEANPSPADCVMAKVISRRSLVARTAGAMAALAGGGGPPPAVADEEIKEADKIKQADAKYQNHPNGPQRCEICLQFVPPAKCKIVQGPIIPQGWCQFFAARENAH